MTGPLLDVTGLTRRYGGLTALDDVSLELPVGQLHAVIGPNGAGKSTLVGLLGGESRPDAGRIVFDGQDITSLAAPARALRGLARAYQITSVFPEFTVLENVVLACQPHQGHSLGFWKPVLKQPRLVEPARRSIARVGLAHHEHTPVAQLAHGERRQLELAMVLVSEPRLLLLDEPMAGMGQAESLKVIELLQGLKGHYTILLVEHDMQAVFALADRISVLVYGQVIARGEPADIARNPEVRTAYLGDESLPEAHEDFAP